MKFYGKGILQLSWRPVLLYSCTFHWARRYAFPVNDFPNIWKELLHSKLIQVWLSLNDGRLRAEGRLPDRVELVYRLSVWGTSTRGYLATSCACYDLSVCNRASFCKAATVLNVCFHTIICIEYVQATFLYMNALRNERPSVQVHPMSYMLRAYTAVNKQEAGLNGASNIPQNPNAGSLTWFTFNHLLASYW